MSSRSLVCRRVMLLSLLIMACCHTPNEKRMENSAIETMVHISWGAAREQLSLSLAPFPEYGESDGQVVKTAPELPLFRAQEGGAVAVLNYFGHRFLPEGTLKWFYRAPGARDLHVHTAAYPFASGDAATVVDFLVRDGEELILLEKVSGPEGRAFSRLALISSRGSVLLKTEALDGGPYVRIVPDDAGRLFLLAREDGNSLSELDLADGRVAKRYTAVPGTMAALAANKGTSLSRAQLEAQDPARIAAPPELPAALVYLFGVDAEGNYYVAMSPEIIVVTFGGKILRRISMRAYPELLVLDDARTGTSSRLSLSVSWQVDRAGRVYISRVSEEGFQVLRLAPA